MGNSKALLNSPLKRDEPPLTNRSARIMTYKTLRETEHNEPLPAFLHSGSSKVHARHSSRNLDILVEIDFDAPTAKLLSHQKTESDKALIKKALQQHFIFSSLPEENLSEVIGNMKLYQLKNKETLFYQGNPGSKFFVVHKGSLEIIKNNEQVGILSPGQGFGEFALIHDMRRTATIKTLTPAKVWAISRQVFRDILKTINSLLYEENKQFLLSVPFLQILTEDQLKKLSSLVITQNFSHGDKIIIEGDPAGAFYIIKEGSVDCEVAGVVVRSLEKGELFGEQALLYNTNRTATVKAVNKVQVLSVGKELLKGEVGDRIQSFLYKNTLRIAFDSCQYLEGLSHVNKEKMIDSFQIFVFSKGEVAIPKGAVKGRHIWIVLKGNICDGKKSVTKFGVIGAKWAYNKTEGIVQHNYFADDEVDLGIVKIGNIENLIGGQLEEVTRQTVIVSLLQKIFIFRMLSEEKLYSITAKVRTKEFKQNEKIFDQGEKAESLYIVKEGEVDIIKDSRVIRTITPGNYFGEKSIIIKETRTASAISKTNSVLWVLNQEDFSSIITPAIQSLLVKRINLQDDLIALEDLVVVEQLGKGTFGSVYLCAKKQNKVLYALKVISRKKIDSYNLHDSLHIEKKILQRVEHQFIVKLVKTFKTPKKLFFLLEYIQGPSLFEVLNILDILNGSKAKFYTCCLLLILEHLHQNSIIYRDVKPENIMVEEDGYLKLLDFGTAKIIENRTFTVIGTPHYMAPEVILGKGYSFTADLWSLGIMVYEMLCGKVPFGENIKDDPFSVYRAIIAGSYSFPHYVNDACQEIVNDLLHPVGAQRRTATNFKKHRWFDGVDWESITSRRKCPPYKPKIADLSQDVERGLERNKSVEVYLSKHVESSILIDFKIENKVHDKNWDKDF